MHAEQIKKWARMGAKQDLRKIVATFPGILGEFKHDQAVDRAAHARNVKQTRRKTAK